MNAVADELGARRPHCWPRRRSTQTSIAQRSTQSRKPRNESALLDEGRPMPTGHKVGSISSCASGLPKIDTPLSDNYVDYSHVFGPQGGGYYSVGYDSSRSCESSSMWRGQYRASASTPSWTTPRCETTGSFRSTSRTSRTTHSTVCFTQSVATTPQTTSATLRANWSEVCSGRKLPSSLRPTRDHEDVLSRRRAARPERPDQRMTDDLSLARMGEDRRADFAGLHRRRNRDCSAGDIARRRCRDRRGGSRDGRCLQSRTPSTVPSSALAQD